MAVEYLIYRQTLVNYLVASGPSVEAQLNTYAASGYRVHTMIAYTALLVQILLVRGEDKLAVTVNNAAAEVHVTAAPPAITVAPAAAAVNVQAAPAAVTVQPSAAAVNVQAAPTAVNVQPSTATVNVEPSRAAVNVGPAMAAVNVEPTAIPAAGPVQVTIQRVGMNQPPRNPGSRS